MLAKNLTFIVGIVFLAIGVIGFLQPELLGFHLTPLHNIVHLATGAIAFMMLGNPRMFLTVFGVVYAALGLIGLLGVNVVLLGPERSGALIETGIVDNAFHFVVGVVLLVVGLVKGK